MMQGVTDRKVLLFTKTETDTKDRERERWVILLTHAYLS